MKEDRNSYYNLDRGVYRLQKDNNVNYWKGDDRQKEMVGDFQMGMILSTTNELG